MSALASLANVPLTDQERLQWTFSHMAHHRDINRVIFQLTGIYLIEYSLDPVNPNDTGQWEYQHQIMHDNQNAVLGINGNDLSEIDWKNPNLLTGWVWLNWNEHYQAAAILEIG